MIEQIELLESQISEIEKIIEELYSKFDSKLTKIPGMGTTLAAVILSEIGDISRFPDSKQLTAFAGLDPVLKQSGKNKGLGYHMSKRGSPYLRRALWLAANSIKKWDPSFAYAYQKKTRFRQEQKSGSLFYFSQTPQRCFHCSEKQY